MEKHSKKYTDYINSLAWKTARCKFISNAEYTCQRCGADDDDLVLEVHHLHYRTLGNERDEDVMVLCQECHKIEDLKRSTRTYMRRWNARLDAWAKKRYGDYWHDVYTRDDLADEFEEFLEWYNA